jgi:hypothetical protein
MVYNIPLILIFGESQKQRKPIFFKKFAWLCIKGTQKYCFSAFNEKKVLSI